MQFARFLAHRMGPRTGLHGRDLSDLYRSSVKRAFNAEARFIVTGAPHAAYYPRNFAWFYPDLLNPATIVDSADAANRCVLVAKSLMLMCRALRGGVHTTTLVPISSRRIVGINYFSEPSDSLLGLLAALDQLLTARNYANAEFAAVYAQAAAEGQAIGARYGSDIAAAVVRLAADLAPYRATGTGAECLLCDGAKSRSAATDARAERARFVTNANVWTTLSWAAKMHIADRNKIEATLGRTLDRYKSELLAAFAADGFVQHSLGSRPQNVRSHSIALDFAHVRNGFWNFADPEERRVFRSTAEIVLRDPAFRTRDCGLFVVSVARPRERLLHRAITPSYQGRSAWIAFNVEFADRLLDLSVHEGPHYAQEARRLLRAALAVVKRHQGYPEVVSPEGMVYRTWAYRSAWAHSWFPRLISAWHRASCGDGRQERDRS